MEFSELRGAPSPLADDDFVITRRGGVAAHDERLQHAHLAHRIGELLQIVVAEATPRLIAAWTQEVDRHRLRRAVVGRAEHRRADIAEQRRKTLGETAALAAVV